MSTATTMTMTIASIVWMTLPTTWPVSTETRAMSIVRNRAMMPSVMSMATEMAVPWAAPATVIRRIPGTTYAMYSSRPPDDRPRPAPSVPPKTYTNRSRSTTGMPAMKTSARGSGASGGGCAGASWPSRPGRAGTRSSHGHLLFVRVAGERQEDVVEVGGLTARARRRRSNAPRACRAGPAGSRCPPSLGTWRVSDSSSRDAPSKARAARSSSAASANESWMWPPGPAASARRGCPRRRGRRGRGRRSDGRVDPPPRGTASSGRS